MSLYFLIYYFELLCVLPQSCVGLVDDEEKYDEDDPTKNYEVIPLSSVIIIFSIACLVVC